ncbi:MAG: QueT transporter family protein [Eubacterium sp.]|nr:QueT transporter family protein [Eubacterium sp.]
MKSKKIYDITFAAMVAALYVVLTLASNSFGLASGVIQVRLSEALCILPYFTPAAIPGLTVGCLLSNWITGCALPDIIFGTLATLIGALGSYALRQYKFLVPLPPIISNMVIVPWVLRFAYDVPDSIPYMMVTVGAGEVIACGVLGLALLFALIPLRGALFKTDKVVKK